MRKLVILFLALCMLLMASCSEQPKNSGKDKAVEEDTSVVEIPTIKSSDQVMPLYFDISLYDEEDYAQIYLGKNFKYDFTYSGSKLKLPSDYIHLKEQGWTILGEVYNENSIIKAGETVSIKLANNYDKQLSVTLYNKESTSVKLSECPIVKFAVLENNSLIKNSAYDQFSINGVSNFSTVTDVIYALGAPSHFETFYENEYRLSYFVSKADRRDKITVTVDVENDCVKAVEVAKYN